MTIPSQPTTPFSNAPLLPVYPNCSKALNLGLDTLSSGHEP